METNGGKHDKGSRIMFEMWHDIKIYTTNLAPSLFNGQIAKYKNKDFVDAKYSNVSAMASQKMYQHFNWQKLTYL